MGVSSNFRVEVISREAHRLEFYVGNVLDALASWDARRQGALSRSPLPTREQIRGALRSPVKFWSVAGEAAAVPGSEQRPFIDIRILYEIEYVDSVESPSSER